MNFLSITSPWSLLMSVLSICQFACSFRTQLGILPVSIYFQFVTIRESYVFTRICHSVHGGGGSPGPYPGRRLRGDLQA